MSKRADSRPTIGLLTDWSENPYQTMLRKGVVDAAVENDVNLICFVGGALDATNQYESQRNFIYSLIHKSKIEGLVISSAAIGHYITIEKIKEFCKQFGRIPITSIALALGNVPSVLVDNNRGLQDLLDHLIVVHKYKKIAFISGPEHNPEAVNRFQIFKDCLNKFDLPFNKNLYVAGDFMLQTGMDAVKILLGERKAEFDVIVAANDEMARGALGELQNRGLQVPGQIAVVGFDDVEESKYYSPALTTVRQPLYEQGKKATELLLQIIEGKKVPDQIFLPTQLIIRESCGCLSQNILEFSTPYEKKQDRDFITWFAEEKVVIVSALKKAYTEWSPAETSPDSMHWAEPLVEAFHRELAGKENGVFLSTMNSFLYQVMTSKDAIRNWQTILSIFRITLLPYLVSKELISQGETIWQQARIMVSEIGHRLEYRQRLQSDRENQLLRDLSEKLITKIELEPLLAIVESELPKIGIKSCYLSLYEQGMQPGDFAATSRLILAYNESGSMLKAGEEKAYCSSELIPVVLGSINRRYTMLMEALFYGADQLGFGLFEMGPDDGRVYEMLRLRLSSALRGTLLFKELQQQAENLEIMVEKRTTELREANSKLQLEITERKNAEDELKRSNLELEQFAYIASHDLQEPLRMIGSFVGLLARRYQGRLDQNADEYIEFVVDGVNRMRNMINDLLAYSRVRSRVGEKTQTDFAALLAESLQALQIVINEKKAVITFDRLPVLFADSVHIRLLLQNLLSNALKFQKDEPPRIHIGCQEHDKEVVIFVKDEGIGLAPEYKDNIFIMFKRLHAKDEYPGTGIGLAICKKIVEMHAGQIWVDSALGQGSTFYFSIPK